MARPIKDNADYFTHDADMRDDPKIKALRRKFKITGYGVWCMLLEIITDSDNFTITYDNISLELIAGDFDIEVDELATIMQYCVQIDLLQISDNKVRCRTLEKRFDSLIRKRERDRNRVIADNRGDNTHSKVKKSKEEESKALPITPDVYDSKENAFTEIRDNDQFIEECQRTLSGRGWMVVTPVDVIACLKQFMNGKADITTPKDNVRQHFKNWLIREKIENLITISEVFKKSVTNGRAERRQA